MTVPVDVIQKLAPIVHLHHDEQYRPCSIEHMMANGALRDLSPTPVDAQGTSVPAIAAFKGKLWMVYSGSTGAEVWVTSSEDGLLWDKAVKIDHETSIPALAVLNDTLWMVYTDKHSSQLYSASSTDGLKWSPRNTIAGQGTSVPALAAFNGKLWMVYTDSHSSQIWVTSSTDGIQWVNVHQIGQQTSIPALTVFAGKLWMVYTGSNSADIYVTYSTDGDNWQHAWTIGQKTSVPALTTFNNKLWMAYSDEHSSDIWVTCSADGYNWTDGTSSNHARKIGQNTSIPALAAFNDRLCMVYSDAQSSKLWATRSDNGVVWQRPDIFNPKQTDLAAHRNDGYYLAINESQYPGMALEVAPMYYAVEEYFDFTKITYVILFAYNGHQTMKVINASSFYCVLDNFARHPGDLEVVTVLYTNGPTGPVVQKVMFEAHGNGKEFSANEVEFSGTHPVVHCSLNGHGTFNRLKQGDWVVSEPLFVIDVGDALGDFEASGTGDWAWTPHDFRLLGLDDNDNPVGDQVWAAFKGRLGGYVENRLNGARYLRGTGLNSNDWAAVKGLSILQEMFHSNIERTGRGPAGPGTRSYLKPNRLLHKSVFNASSYVHRYADLAAATNDAYGLAKHWLIYGLNEGRRASPEFDVQFYLNHNADLKATFGTNNKAACEHWVANGIREGRRASPEFDVSFYLDNNADLQAAVGTSHVAALDHWFNSGLKEGRRGSFEFDVQFYVNQHADLQAAFGTDKAPVLDHWLTTGLKEGRRSSAEFDVSFYLNTNPDLRATLGTSYVGALDHWFSFGLNEGRRAAFEFDVQFYLNQYPDLKSAFGTNYAAARNHWLQNGLREGRRGSAEFDVSFYLNNNADLKAAFGTNYAAALAHWFSFGLKEGRRSSQTFDVQYYVNAYPDLKTTFGTNYGAAIMHWFTDGKAEGLRTVPEVRSTAG